MFFILAKFSRDFMALVVSSSWLNQLSLMVFQVFSLFVFTIGEGKNFCLKFTLIEQIDN